MKRWLMVLLFALAAGPLFGSLLPESLKFQRNGSFYFHEIKFEITVGDSHWHFVNNKDWKNCTSKIERSGVKVSGVILPGSGRGTITETVTPLDGTSFELKSTLTMSDPVKLNQVGGKFSLPVGGCSITVDGKAIAVPKKTNGKRVKLYSGKGNKVVLRTYGAEELVVTGANRVLVQDNRRFKTDTVSVIFYFTGGGGTAAANLNLKLTLRRIPGQCVPLDRFANRAFCDGPENKLPVWTLQGPEESLYMFRPGRISALGLDFDVPSRGAVAVGGEERGGVPQKLTVPVNVPAGMRSLNLLHTSAWTPADKFGVLAVEFADGTAIRFPVTGARDCGDWVHPSRSLENAAVAWTGERSDKEVGIYLSTFLLPQNKKPVAVTLHSANRGVIWFVMGMTFAPGKILLSGKTNRPDRIEAGKQWQELKFRNQTVPGSPLDFSFLADAPAGKYGYVRPAPDGTLRFEKAPERRLKLCGTNLCASACFPPKEMADKIAAQLARNGYNAVRIHHHDNPLVAPGASDSTTLNPEMLDRLDYFIAALKKHGIYITTDLYTSRKFKPGDNLPEMDPKRCFQAVPAAMENWKRFVRNWLTHRNPYTGLTLAEEPALVFVNLVNEDDPWQRWNHTLTSRKYHIELFEKWKRKHGCPDAKANNTDRRFVEFILELKGKSLAEMTRFLKEELKLQASTTSLNQHNGLHFVLLRNQFDVVDDHGYNDARLDAVINGKAALKFSQVSPIAGFTYMPRTMMTARNPGKPFFMTEFNHCRPNRFRAASGPLMGGYAALQDWDGIFRFCYSHNISRIVKNCPAMSCFESVADPVMQLSDRIIGALLVRGDARPAGRCFSRAVPEDVLKTDVSLSFPLNFQMLGFVTGIGSHVDGASLPPGTVAVDGDHCPVTGRDAALWREILKKKRTTSSTGELAIDMKADTFIVNTPRTESLTLPGGTLATGGVLSVKGTTTYSTIAAISLDGKKLAGSRSILLLHLTDISNSGASFFDSEHHFMDRGDQGKLPLLVRTATADVSLKLDGDAVPEVCALSADGERLGAVPVVRRNGEFQFKADTGCFPAGVMAYEVTRRGEK